MTNSVPIYCMDSIVQSNMVPGSGARAEIGNSKIDLFGCICAASRKATGSRLSRQAVFCAIQLSGV